MKGSQPVIGVDDPDTWVLNANSATIAKGGATHLRSAGLTRRISCTVHNEIIKEKIGE